MNIWSLLFALMLVLACVMAVKVLSRVLNPGAMSLLGWAVGLSAYVAWCISFLKASPPPPEDRDLWVLLLWLALFPYAVLLAFPPGVLKPRKIYRLAMASFVAAEVWLVWSAFQMLRDPNFDDSAGAFLVVPMMLFPACLFAVLLAIRLFWSVLKPVHRKVMLMARQPHAADADKPRR
ncbi:MAG: hypothetical protein ACK5TE_04500 [Pseudomonadota bacterium]